jgi:hypothetical protein
MVWPKELIDAFDAAVEDVTLNEGYTKAKAIVRFLDTAASMAVWRCKGDAESLEPAYFWPYTPIGHLTNTGFAGTMRRFSVGGPRWGEALDLLKAFIRANGERIIREYEAHPIPYPHEI